MERRFAHLISVIFHPLLMPLFMVFIVFSSDIYVSFSVNEAVKKMILFIIIANTIFFPGLIFIYLRNKGVIKSLEMETPEERRFPYLITLVFYFATYYLLRQLNLPGLIYLLILGAAITVILAFLINLKWKISVHMLGVGGLVGTLLGFSMKFGSNMLHFLTPIIIMSGLVGYARLKLKAHTQAQVYVGFLLGVMVLGGLIVMI